MVIKLNTLLLISYLMICISCTTPSGKNMSARLDNGEQIYQKHCTACHQADGNGIANQYPPLSNTKWVNADKEELILILLEGLSGEMEVKGKVYNSIMSPYDFLSDQDIADVLTYIRKNFSNDAEPISREKVAAVRSD